MDTSRPISIVLADDHPAVLEGVRALLGRHREFNVVSTCRDGRCTLQAIRDFTPDLALLDLRMPLSTGLDVLSSITADAIETKVIFFIASISGRQVLEAIARGAKGIILKDAEPDELMKCLRDVAAGHCYLPYALVDAAIEHETGRLLESECLIDALTARERQVVR